MEGKRKIRFDCAKMAKCGLTSLSRCKLRKAGLEECKTCKLVSRVTDRWKIIDMKPHKKCGHCGKFLPLTKFYSRKIIKPNGVVYNAYQGICKMCRSKIRYERIKATE